MTFSFAWLLDTVTPKTFFAEYSERRPLLIARGEPARYAALLSLAGIDLFLATTSPCHPDVFLVDAARKLGAEDYTLAEPEGVGHARALSWADANASKGASPLRASWRPVGDLGGR